MNRTKSKWTVTLFLFVLAAVSCGVLLGAASSLPRGARAAGDTVSVSNETGLRDAVEQAAGLTRTVKLTRDITLTGGTLTVSGNVTLTGTGKLTLSGGGGAAGQIAVSDKSVLTVNGLEITHPQADGPMFFLYGSAALNLDGARLIGTSDGVYRVLNTNSGNAAFYLNDTSVLCGASAYPFNQGNFIFSGTTSYEGKFPAASDVHAPYCYDFRGVSVEAAPVPDAFQPLDEVALSLTKQGVFFKGMGAPQETEGKIWFTKDGSDPRVSETAEEYTKPFRLHVSGTIRAAFRYRGFYQYVPDAYAYELYPSEGEGAADRFEAFEDISISCGDTLPQASFPDVLTVYLKDGRNFEVAADWGDVTRYEFYEAGEQTVYATVILPEFIKNPDGLKPQCRILISAEEIDGFTCNALSSAQEGKNTVREGSAVAAFSAAGGNNHDYTYTLTAAAGMGKDNGRFLIEGDKLIVAGDALTAGTYTVCVTAVSGGKTKTESFEFTVKERGEELLISNPYASIDWESASRIKTATHDHTVNTNNKTGWNDNVSDTPDERVEYYRGLGYGAVIIADHDYVSFPWNADGTYPAKNILGIPGSELSKNQHVLSYNCNYYDYESQGPAKKHTYAENVENVHAAGGFIYLAHPCRNDPSTPHQFWYDIVETYPWVYGMEVLNAGQFTRNHSEGLWDEILTRNMPYRNLWGTASDDAHSNSAAGTGWATLLLSEDEMNSAGVANALMNGKYTFSSYRVEVGADDNKRDPGVPTPEIQSISVDKTTGTITVVSQNTGTVEWISEGGAVVAYGATVNVNETYGTGKYIRARLKGAGGQTLTQPFALYEKNDEKFAEKVTADYNAETLTFDADSVEADTTGNFDGEMLFSGAALLPGQTVYLRGKRGSEIEGFAMTLTVPGRLAAPALTAGEATATSVSVTAVEGGEYRLGEDGAWQSSPVFNGLTSDTEYRIYARIRASAAGLKSDTASVTVRTQPADSDGTDAPAGCGCGSVSLGGGGAAGLAALITVGGLLVAAIVLKKRRRS